MAGWLRPLHEVTVRLAGLMVEQGTLRAQEILQRQQVANASQSKSVSGVELDERIATSDLRAELARITADISRHQLVHDTLVLYVNTHVPYNSDIDPWLSLTTSKR